MTRRYCGWTLIELVIVVVVVSLLSVATIVKFHDFMSAVRVTVTKDALALMRKGIRDFYLDQAMQGHARVPTLTETFGGGEGSVLLSTGEVLANPFDTDGDTQNIVRAGIQRKGTIIGTQGGWAYRPRESSAGAGDAGQIWPNTSTKGVHENYF